MFSCWSHAYYIQLSMVQIHFGLSKSMMQLTTDTMNVENMANNGGNVSPPMLSDTPSPPMGPPSGGPASPSRHLRPKSDSDRVYYKVC